MKSENELSKLPLGVCLGEKLDAMRLESGREESKGTSYNINPLQSSKKSYEHQSSSQTSMKDRAYSYQGQNLAHQIDEFERRNSKGNKKKGKKGFKWEKPESYKDLLGFDEYGTSPFEHDNGYDINDLDLIHFKERPIKKRGHKSSHFSTSQHVQANHRFILKPNRDQDYFFATYDPDFVVEWEDIFMVLAKRNTDYICPICREEQMVVPVVNKCGHIFCWP